MSTHTDESWEELVNWAAENERDERLKMNNDGDTADLSLLIRSEEHPSSIQDIMEVDHSFQAPIDQLAASISQFPVAGGLLSTHDALYTATSSVNNSYNANFEDSYQHLFDVDSHVSWFTDDRGDMDIFTGRVSLQKANQDMTLFRSQTASLDGVKEVSNSILPVDFSMVHCMNSSMPPSSSSLYNSPRPRWRPIRPAIAQQGQDRQILQLGSSSDFQRTMSIISQSQNNAQMIWPDQTSAGKGEPLLNSNTLKNNRSSRNIGPRKRKIPSGIPEMWYHEITLQVNEKQEQPLRTRNIRPCFRCQVQKKKCYAGFPCTECQLVIGNAVAKRSRQTLQWTTCFDADIEELNVIYYEALGGEEFSLTSRELQKVDKILLSFYSFYEDEGEYDINYMRRLGIDLKDQIVELYRASGDPISYRHKTSKSNFRSRDQPLYTSEPNDYSDLHFQGVLLEVVMGCENTPKRVTAAIAKVYFKTLKCWIKSLRSAKINEENCVDLYEVMVGTKQIVIEMDGSAEYKEMTSHLSAYFEYYVDRDELGKEISRKYSQGHDFGSIPSLLVEQVRAILIAS